ncbi:MAG: hypothetical protein HZB55_08155 [Deltaproteobacteria bacterium]|nr:hypothetical protein [Deltaproteobacteria bacterium]
MGMRGIVLATVLAGLVLGCAAAPTRAPPTAPRPARSGYPLAIQFTSAVPDDYEVLSGPTETYRRLRINDRLRRLLDAYGREKSDASSPKRAELLVHLDRVTTGYRQIGFRRSPPAPVGRVVPASFDDDVFRDDDRRPEEITKTASVALTVEVRSEGRTLLREPIQVDVTETTKREDIDLWTYDYSGLIDQALGKALERLDALVDQALGKG